MGRGLSSAKEQLCSPAEWSRHGAKGVLGHSDNVPKIDPVDGELVSSLAHGHPSEPLVVVQQRQGLILADGPAWHQNRRVCSHAFHQVGHLDIKCKNNKTLTIHKPLSLSQEGATQSARVRGGEQQGGRQGGDQGQGSAADKKHSNFHNEGTTFMSNILSST